MMAVKMTFSDGRNMSVGRLPESKWIALYTIRGCNVEVLAWFRNETQAADFCRIMWNVTYPDALPYSEPIEGTK